MFGTSFLVLALVAQTGAAGEPAKHPGFEVTASESKLKIYGFARLDTEYNDSKANDPQIIQWIKSEDAAAPLGANTARPDTPELTIHPKLTRIGLDVSTPPAARLGNAKVSGKIEIDFYGSAASESREALRMRHGYLRLGWEHASLLVGQTSDLIAPLFPISNLDGVMWNAGNLGDRRPQVRFELTPKIGENRLYLQAMAGQTGAVDNQSLDGGAGATALDGVDAGTPMLQGRVALGGKHPWLENKTYEIGLWGEYSKEALPDGAARIAGKDEWTSDAVGVDVKLPLHDRLALEAEAWSGEDLDDVRGGIGQGVNNRTVSETENDPGRGKEIASTGGWAQLAVKASDLYTLAFGASLDDPGDNLPAAGARTRNSVIYLANRFTPASTLTFGADYLNWTTEWNGGMKDGKANRIDLFAQYSF